MSETIQIKIDAAQIERLGNLLGAAGSKAPQALRHAVNHTGKKARTAMIKVLAPQTGLKQKLLRRALKASLAFSGGANGGGREEFVIKSKGGNIALKFFKHREKGDGVDANVWGSNHHYAGAFTKVGWRKRRSTDKFHGHVMRRSEFGTDSKNQNYPIRLVKSGLDIPDEMVSGESRAAFFRVVESDLAPRMFYELTRVIPGWMTSD